MGDRESKFHTEVNEMCSETVVPIGTMSSNEFHEGIIHSSSLIFAFAFVFSLIESDVKDNKRTRPTYTQ